MKTCLRIRVTKMEGKTVSAADVLDLSVVDDGYDFSADLPVKVGDVLNILSEPVEVVRV